MPLQAQIADKLTVIRGLKFKGKHDPYELLSGFPSARSGEIRGNEKWPVLGARGEPAPRRSGGTHAALRQSQ